MLPPPFSRPLFLFSSVHLLPPATTGSRRARAPGADGADGQRDAADMVSRVADPHAEPKDVDGAGRKAGKAGRATGKGAEGESPEMMSRFRDDSGATMPDGGMLAFLEGLVCEMCAVQGEMRALLCWRLRISVGGWGGGARSCP